MKAEEFPVVFQAILQKCLEKHAHENTTGIDVSETGMSKELSFAINTILTGMTCIFGLSANTMSFYILGKDSIMPINILLRSLAVFDSMFLACMFVLSFKGVHTFNGQLEEFHVALPYIKLVLFPLAYLSQTLSTWCIVLVTVYRFVAVIKPIWSAVACTNARAQIHVVLMAITAVLYNAPRVFEFRVIDKMEDCLANLAKNESKAMEYLDEWKNMDSQILWNHTSINHLVFKKKIISTALYKNHYYKLVYISVSYVCFMYIIPISLLGVMNYLLIKTYRKAIVKSVRMMPSSIRHGTTRRTERKDKNITRMVIGLVSLFLACVLPDVISQFLIMMKADTFYNTFSQFSNLFLVINSSMNFIVYCLLAGRFRKLLYQTMNCCRCGKPSKYRGMTLSRQKTFITEAANA